VKMHRDHLFHGEHPYGTFSMKTGDLKKIIIKDLTEQGR